MNTNDQLKLLQLHRSLSNSPEKAIEFVEKFMAHFPQQVFALCFPGKTFIVPTGEFFIASADIDEVKKMRNQLVSAIKHLRNVYDLGLKDAKDIVEIIFNNA